MVVKITSFATSSTEKTLQNAHVSAAPCFASYEATEPKYLQTQYMHKQKP